MESVPSIGILLAKNGKIHFTPIAIITAKAVVKKSYMTLHYIETGVGKNPITSSLPEAVF